MLRTRRGFTVLEATVASTLVGFQALLIAAAWSGLGRPLRDTTALVEIQEEAQRAANFLAEDFGGQIDSALLGKKKKGKKAGKMAVGQAQLRLCFDGGSDPNGVADWADPDTVVTYSLQSGELLRTNQSTGGVAMVARYVEEVKVKDQGNGMSVEITFDHQGVRRKYVFLGMDP
jgi:type II secretory pathway component PulJ